MNTRTVTVLAVVLIASIYPKHAYGVCTGGSIGGFTQYLSGQLADVVLTSGVPSTVNITPYYVSFSSTSGNCGIFARSTVPGTTIRDTYCSTNCITHPAGEFAAIGSAYAVPFNVVAPNRTGGVNNYIPLAFDGSAPAGTQGLLELAYADNDNGNLSTAFVFAQVPVYVESPTPPSAWGRVTSMTSTISGSRLILSHPYLDSKPSARLFVSHVYNPNGALAGTGWNNPISVEYDQTLTKWTIKNADGAPMAAGLGFNFRVDPTAKQICVPPPSTGNEFTSSLAIDDYNSNDNIYATLIVTPVSGAAHPIAVKYTRPRWAIVYADGSLLPGGACFNVKVIAFSQYIDDPAQGDLSGKLQTTYDNGVGQDMGGFGSNHTINGIRVFQFNWSSGNTALPMIFTSNLTPMGYREPAAPDVKYSSLWITPACITTSCVYPARHWALRHADGSPVPGLMRMNVWAAYQPAYPPDGLRTPRDVRPALNGVVR
jgi:hypothetical protein